MPKKINRFESFDTRSLQRIRPSALSKVPADCLTTLGTRPGRFTAPGPFSNVHVLVGAVQSALESVKALFNYLESRETTRRMEIWSATVIQDARETTHRMEVQAAAMVEMARQHAREVEVNAQTAQAEIQDRQHSREAKMKIIASFMDSRREYEAQLLQALSQTRGNLSVEERMFLNREREVIQRRLRDLDAAVAAMSATL
jgi:hypothetical protein